MGDRLTNIEEPVSKFGLFLCFTGTPGLAATGVLIDLSARALGIEPITGKRGSWALACKVPSGEVYDLYEIALATFVPLENHLEKEDQDESL